MVGRTPSGAFDVNFCDVDGDSDCDVSDLYRLDRATKGESATILDSCPGYTL